MAASTQRLWTAAVLVPVALAAVFFAPPPLFLGLLALLFAGAAWELAALAKSWAPGAPLALLAPLAAVTGVALASSWAHEPWAATAGAAALTLGVGTLVLLSRTPVKESLPALGAFTFGVPYVALPIAALARLHREDPWLLILLFAIVWLGDTAAYYVGSRVGRHKMAPVISPNKSWEGAIAGMVTSVTAAALWCIVRQHPVSAAFLGLAALTAVAAQVGDLVESMLKRGAGSKDSGTLLPGHGGLLDRFDALLFAGPVMAWGWLWLTG